ncbi:MAG: hypothetical protein PHF37_08500 [Phycisphaerae bacterium]|nr:hypothetical protein [Phycisphaerae bacterium]
MMSFENWQNENKEGDFLKWRDENAINATMETDPVAAAEKAGQAWDISTQSDIPLEEADHICGIKDIVLAPSDFIKKTASSALGAATRLRHQLFNKTIADTLHTLGKSESSAVQDRAYELVVQYEKENNFTFGEYFNDQVRDWTEQLTVPPEARADEYLRKEPQYNKPRPDINPFAYDVSEPEKFGEKAIDAVAGITGFVAQIALLKKVAPSMSQPVVWETVNLANDGKPGGGAAMQVTLGGINKILPGAGILPAVGRGTAASTLFGTTTYLGGGDTTDILINIGIPFAFEGMNITKQTWANYKNKAMFLDSLKQKAPALAGTDNVLIDKAISDLLTNIATEGVLELRQKGQMQKEFAPKAATPELSAEVRAYMQQKRYSELLEKANAGDKKAIEELNDYVQGKNIPTYEELLEKGYNGDSKAFERIAEGDYYGGSAMRPALKATETPTKAARAVSGEEPTLGMGKAGAKPTPAQRPATPIEQMRDAAKVKEIDIKTPVSEIGSADLSKARERGFITSAKEVLPELKIEGQYIPRSTDVLAIKARNLIVDDITKAEQVARKGSDQNAVATASELIKHYSDMAAKAKTQSAKEAAYDKAADIAQNMAAKLTELGRAVQAASILGRLTPEGQVRFAAREIQKYNEKVEKGKGADRFRKKIPGLTKEQAQKILEEMSEIAKMPNGKEKFIRFQKVQDYISKLVPTPTMDKIATLWKAGLLTGIKTSGLNIFANEKNLELEVMKDIPAAAVDKIVSYFTGKRTVTPTIKGLKKGFIEGLGNGLEYLKSGYSDRDIGVKLDYHKVNYNTRAFQAYTETVFRFLGAQDQPFYYAARLRSLYGQAKTSAINLGLKGQAAQKHVDALIENPTEQMIKNAAKDAEAAVFINETALGNIARGIQRLPGGEFIVPFGRTPSAVAMQVVNYSPVGIVKTIIENIGKGRFDQREFSMGIGRGITGIPALVIGARLEGAGMITLDRPKDEKERELWKLEGRQPNSVLINGKWRTVQSLGPAGNLLIIGAHFQRAFDEESSPTAAMGRALTGSAKSFTEQTFLRGVNLFVDALNDPELSGPMLVNNTISSFVPTIVSDVARATDTQERRAESVGEKVMARIPGARQTLEPQITVLGEEKEQTSNPLELMIDPTRPSKEISSPVIAELRRLWNEGWEVSPSLLGDKKGYDVLSQEENTELWKRAGAITKDSLGQLVSNKLYGELPDEKKAELIGKLITESQKVSRIEMVAKKLTGIEGKELTDMIFELRKSGLATEDIIPIALSKRNPRKARKGAE